MRTTGGSINGWNRFFFPDEFSGNEVWFILKSLSAGLLETNLPVADKVPGIRNGGRLVVKGSNVMLGYLKVDDPGVIQPPVSGWYDTGDIVDVDEDGFVSIKGRAKRFAKVAGEMVSLTAMEGLASRLWPDDHHAAIALPDERKGEQIILVTDRPHADRSELQVWARENGIAELLVPKEIRVLDKLPVLGTGKIDYVALQDAVRTAPETFHRVVVRPSVFRKPQPLKLHANHQFHYVDGVFGKDYCNENSSDSWSGKDVGHDKRFSHPEGEETNAC